MATLATINATDLITNSRTDINNNFANLNSAKLETSLLTTDPSLSADSDLLIPSQAAVKTYVDAGGSAANLQRLLPTGTMLPYGAATAPSFFLLCDGSAISRTTFAALFAIIGTSYGAGNGTSTFNLPDARGRVIVGSGTGVKVATVASVSGNVITITGLTNIISNEFQTGQQVTYASTGSVITGLTTATSYFVIRTGNLTISLATTLANAQNGVAIALSSSGSGVQTFTLTLTARTAGDQGGEETHAMSSSEILSHFHTNATSNAGAGTGIATPQGQLGANPTSTVGGNVAMNNMQPFMVAAWIIKT